MSNNEIMPAGTYKAVAVLSTFEDGSESFAKFARTKNGNKQVAAYFKVLNAPEGAPSWPVAWYGSFSATKIGKNKDKSVAQVTV